MKRYLAFLGLMTLVCVSAVAAPAENDPRIGTWKLNLSKSTSTSGLPQSETRTYTAQGSDIMGDSEGVNAKGQPISTHYNATADGKDHPSGAPGSTVTIAIKQTGPGAYAGTIKRDGKVVGTNTAVISGGGKVFTFKSKGTDPDGKPISSTMVYEKQ